MACTKETVKSNGLNIWSGNSDAAEVDIIAVQGLGAHPFYTWVKQTQAGDSFASKKSRIAALFNKHGHSKDNSVEVMWPRDLLPPLFKNARVATYSYESDWKNRDIKTSLRECAEQLLNVLFQYRQHADTRQRPLVLIGHSLGGLVIQQALVIAVHQRAFTDIRLSVAGIIFLGAPFQGSDAAVYGKWLAQLGRLDTTLLELLKKDNPNLRAISRDFWDSHSDWDIVCFFENRDTVYGPWKTRFVDTQSATLLGKRMIFLNTDHSGLNKFDGLQDENFTLLLPEIQRMVKGGLSIVIDRYRRKDADSINKAEPCSTVPFEEDEDFVGREDILQEMENRLFLDSGHRRVALVGPGGVGKTQIAVEFAVRLRKRTPKSWVFWVHAGSVATFEQSYHEIAKAAKIPGREDPKADMLDLVSRWLKKEKNGPWLMIIDNNDDAELLFTLQEPHGSDQSCIKKRLADYIPHTANGTAIITARDHRAGSKLCDRKPSIEVGRMAAPEAKDLFLRKLQGQDVDKEALASLLIRLECLPLAITQAIAFILENGSTVKEYFKLLTKSESESIKLLSTDLEDGRRYSQLPHSVINTWRLSFDLIKEREPRAAELLSLMCFLNRQGIPRLLLLGKGDDGVDFTRALAPLKSFQLIATDKSGESFEMHGLVQLSTKAWLEARGETETYVELALQSVSEAFPLGEHEDWVLCQQLLPHAEAVLTYDLASERSSVHQAQLSENVSRFYRAKGQYQSSFQMAKKAFDTRTHYMGVEHLDTLLAMGNLASTYSDLGEVQEAKKLELQVLELRTRILGEEHPDTLSAMGNLALTYSELGEVQEAKRLELQVLELRTRILGEEHPDTLLTMGNLASTYSELGEVQEAKRLELQVLELRTRILGEEHPNTLLAMGNLASTYSDLGEVQEAKRLELQVLGLRTRILGEEHPDTLLTMGNLATTYFNLGDFQQAENLELKVLETREMVLGRDHPSTLKARIALAETRDAISRSNRRID